MIYYPLRDPITNVELRMIDLQHVALSLEFNRKQGGVLIMTFGEARQFLLALAEPVPVSSWLDEYMKPVVVDGQGNLVAVEDLP